MNLKHGGMDIRQPQERMKAMPKELEHIRLSEAENGGHVAMHHFKNFEHPPEGPHIFPKMAKHPVIKGSVFHHLAKHLGIPHKVVEPGEEMEEKMEEKIAPGIHAKVAKAEGAMQNGEEESEA